MIPFLLHLEFEIRKLIAREILSYLKEMAMNVEFFSRKSGAAEVRSLQHPASGRTSSRPL